MSLRLVIPLALFGALQSAGAVDTGHAELAAAIYPYEPTYFAIDPGISEVPLNVKFQYSVAFRLIGEAEEPTVRPNGLFLAFSQTSYWDLGSESKPFYDSSYRPEAWWHQDLPMTLAGGRLALEPGIGHESNGRSGPDSRSLNHVFLRALGVWQVDDVVIEATPRIRAYVEKADNPDIPLYRGYADLNGSVLWRNGFAAAVSGRIGSEWDRGSVMLEGSYPFKQLTGGRVHGLLYVQAFVGYSETLVSYDQITPQPRILLGFALTR